MPDNKGYVVQCPACGSTPEVTHEAHMICLTRWCYFYGRIIGSVTPEYYQEPKPLFDVPLSEIAAYRKQIGMKP